VPGFLSSPASVVVTELWCWVNQYGDHFDSEAVLHFGCQFIGIGLSPWRCRYLLVIFLSPMDWSPWSWFQIIDCCFCGLLVSPANIVVGAFLVVPKFEAYIENVWINLRLILLCFFNRSVRLTLFFACWWWVSKYRC